MADEMEQAHSRDTRLDHHLAEAMRHLQAIADMDAANPGVREEALTCRWYLHDERLRIMGRWD